MNRSLLFQYGLLSVAMAVCTIVAAAIPGQAAEVDRGVWPIKVEGKLGWVTALPDGRLMSVWSAGKKFGETIEDTEAIENAYARYSTDNGYTWSEPELLFEYPKSGGTYSVGAPFCDRDGVIHLFGIHYFSRQKSLAVHVMSADGGQSWTRPQYCDFGHEYTGSVNSVIQLDSGRLVFPLSYLPGANGRWADSVVSLSDDGGKTWRPGQEEVEPAAGHHAEPICIQLRDGRIWMLIRNGDGHQFECYSSDEGETWTKPEPSRFVSPSAPAGFLRLRDGRIVVSWTNSLKPKHTLNRLVLAAAISADEGKTWQGYREIARTKAAEGRPWVCYPWLTETTDGDILVNFHGEPAVAYNTMRLDPDWLTETTFRDDFSEGLDNWMTLRTKGVEAIPHPTRHNRQALVLRKPEADTAAGASLNFPFGAQGHLTTRIRLEPGFQGARICLTDYLTWPHYAEDGRFGISIAANGQISVGTGEGATGEGEEAQCEFTPTDVVLEAGKWHTVGFAWDCQQGVCQLSVDYQKVADLPQLSNAPGVCYLRLWSAAEGIDEAGMLVDSVSFTVQP